MFGLIFPSITYLPHLSCSLYGRSWKFFQFLFSHSLLNPLQSTSTHITLPKPPAKSYQSDQWLLCCSNGQSSVLILPDLSAGLDSADLFLSEILYCQPIHFIHLLFFLLLWPLLTLFGGIFLITSISKYWIPRTQIWDGFSLSRLTHWLNLSNSRFLKFHLCDNYQILPAA